MGNSDEGISRTPTTSPTPDNRNTSPYTCIVYDVDVLSEFAPHGAGDFLVPRAASAVVDVPKNEHEMVLLELIGLLESLLPTQSTLDAAKSRL